MKTDKVTITKGGRRKTISRHAFENLLPVSEGWTIVAEEPKEIKQKPTVQPMDPSHNKGGAIGNFKGKQNEGSK